PMSETADVQYAATINSDQLDITNLQLNNDKGVSTMVLKRRGQHWLEPAHGKHGWPNVTSEVFFALWNVPSSLESSKTDAISSQFAVLVPIPPFVLKVGEAGVFRITPTHSAHIWPHEYQTNPVRAIVAISKDPIAIVDFILSHFRQIITAPTSASNLEAHATKMEKESEVTVLPSKTNRFYDKLGWCTWNSCYKNVSEANIISGLNNFKKHQIPIDWLLIDDGWQNVEKDKFLSFGFNKKFSSGPSLISNLKKEFNLSQIAVWHSLVGYWGGIHPNNSLASSYDIREITRKANFIKPTRSNTTFVIDSKSYPKYYADFHSGLREAGIDFFKVDDQSTFEAIADVNNPHELMSTYQQTVTKESVKTPVIWCMAHNMEVLYQTLLFFGELETVDSPRRTMRSSDDFFPDDPDSHTWHIQSNAFNSLLISRLNPQTLMDWDMFQTSHEFAQYHAIARALSNGPVYVSDVIGKHDQSVVLPLLSDDGRLIHKIGDGNAAIPMPKSLLKDLKSGNEGLLFLETGNGNKSDRSGCVVVGVFHCGKSGLGVLNDSFSVVNDLVRNPIVFPRGEKGTKKVAVQFYRSGEISVLDVGVGKDVNVKVSLDEKEAEVVTLSVLWESKNGLFVACMGMTGKYYGAAGIRSIEYSDDDDGVAVGVKPDVVFGGDYTFAVLKPGVKDVEKRVIFLKEGVNLFTI
ncbi:UNVERIFIED_CONTAM: hypothetical protein HDU68_003603, partial [Siphonaria sp. JEL0065]